MKINEELFKKIAKKGTALVLAGTLLVGSNLVLPEQKESVLTVHAQEEVSLEPVNIYGQFGVNLYMDDKRFIPKDANGYEVYPFIVDGTTYVPLRAISDLFEADIKWDDQTKSIYITKKGTQAKLKHEKRERTIFYQAGCTAYKRAKLYIDNQLCVPTDALGNEKDIYIINGTTYVPLRAISTAFGVDINWSSEYNSVYLGRHKTEGLTVDNITDAAFVDKCGRDFLEFGYAMDHEFKIGDQIYSMRKDSKNEKFYPPSYILMLMNYDYYTDDVLYEIWGGSDEFTYYKMEEFTKLIMTYLFNFGSFNWEKYVIEEHCQEGLKQLEKECHYAKETYDYSKIAAFIENYFEGTDQFRYKNTAPITDYIMALFNVVVTRLNATGEYDTSYCSMLRKETYDALQEQLEDLKTRIKQKEKTLTN